MKSLSSKTYQCGVTIQGLTTLSGTVYLTGITNTASWDHVIVGTTAQGQIYTRTYAQFMGDVATGISLSSYVTGSGTTNYLPKFTGGSALGNSQIFDNGTNVGIGTASPSSILDTVVSSGGTSGLRFRGYSDAATPYLLSLGTYSYPDHFQIKSVNGLVTMGIVGATGANPDLAFQTNTTERMRITSGGNILMNTVTATTAGGFTNTTLSVKQVADGLYGGGLHIEENATTSVAYFGFNGIAFNIGTSYRTTGDYRPIAFSTNGAERLRIANDGNIGIGTTSPSYKLQVNGDGNGLYVLGANTSPYTQTIASFVYGGNSNSINIENQGGKASIQARAGGSTMDLLLNPVSGNVGIGTVSPTAKFQVTDASSSITLQNYLNGAAIFLDGVNGDFIGADYFHILADGSSYLGVGGYAGGATPLNVSNSGNVGIGTTAPLQKLHVVTTATAGLSDLTNIDRTSTNLIRFTNPQYSTVASMGILLRVFPDSDTRQGAGIIASGGTNNSETNLSLFVSKDVPTSLSNSYAALTILGNNGNVGIGITSPSYKTEVSASIGNYWNGTAFTGTPLALAITNTTAGGYDSVLILQQTDSGGTSKNSGAIGMVGTGPWTAGNNGSQVSDMYFLVRNASGGISERMRITSTGNVGIGTTSPGAKLDVNGAQIIQSAAGFGTDADQAALFLSNTANFGLSGNFSGYSRNLIKSDGGSILTVGRWNTSLIGELSIESGSSGLIKFLAGASERMRITSGGEFWFKGVSTSTGYEGAITNTETTFDIYGSRYGGTGKALTFWATGAAESMRITSGGNVGIGTTTPIGILHLYKSAAATRLAIDGDAGQNRLISYRTGALQRFGLYVNNTAESGSNAGSNFAIRAYSDAGTLLSTPFFINRASGNIGIGTTSPSQKLDVAGGDIILSSNATYIMSKDASGNTPRMFGINPSNDTYIGPIDPYAGGAVFYGVSANVASQTLYTGATARLHITSAGNIGIGTTSPGYKLDVDGGTVTTVARLYNSSNTATQVEIGDSGNSQYSDLILQSNNGSGEIFKNGTGYTSYGGALSLNIYNSNGAIAFHPNNTANAMFIATSGNVGIGTVSPTNKLDVRGLVGFFGDSSFQPGNLTLTDVTSGGSSWSIYSGFPSLGDFTIRESGVANHLTIKKTSGNVGIGNTSPSTLLDVSGVITATGGNSTNWNTAYGWGNHASASYVPQARTLTINGTSYDLSANRSWTIATTTPGGSDTQVQYNSSGSLAGASALTYNSTTNRVGINQASPGYDLDVNGQVRVQDKLRVGTGNGVVHMSSTATINASATTVVWAQTVSVGMCAFIEYYILNNNSLTDQRAGTIIVTWNQSGTPTITHTETTTPDIGSTIAVNFTSSLVGSDARINAVNSSANPYTMVMSFKYF